MKQIITIGRQYGAGGRDIGVALAKRLGIAYYDTELLQVAVSDSGLNQDFLDSYDETGRRSLLYSLVMGSSGPLSIFEGNSSTEAMAEKAYREAVEHIASKGSCVIVGRCADHILRNEPQLLSVFICSDEADRVKRICERDNLSVGEATQKMKRMDRIRRSYYNYNTDHQWGSAMTYDLCINISKAGAKGAVEQIMTYLKSMEK